jgi:hypothetical protein
VGVARNQQAKPSDHDIDSNEEISKAIRYLDPDRQLENSDILLGVIWILVFVFLGVIMYLLRH